MALVEHKMNVFKAGLVRCESYLTLWDSGVITKRLPYCKLGNMHYEVFIDMP